MQQRVQPLGGPAPPACTAAVRTVGGAQRVRRRRRERVHERVEGRHGVAAHVAVRVAIGGAGVRVLVVVHRRRRVHRRRGAHWGARHSGRHAVCNETVAVGSVGHGAGGCACVGVWGKGVWSSSQQAGGRALRRSVGGEGCGVTDAAVGSVERAWERESRLSWGGAG
eukprot:187177-Chlamydomonas_euryale.AAC.2